MTRSSRFRIVLIGVMLAALLGASRLTLAQPGYPASKPKISASYEKLTIDGLPGSYCWPTADNSSNVCDFISDPQPTAPITVVQGTAVKFLITPDVPAPSTFQATLLDQSNATVRDLLGSAGSLDITGFTGRQRVEVLASYPAEQAGSEYFVTYVFLIDIVAPTATPTATATATATLTPIPPTATPTEVPPTATPTAAPTEAPTAEATETAALTGTESATPEASETAAATETATVVETETPAATETAAVVPSATPEGTETATVEATAEVTETLAATETETPVATVEVTETLLPTEVATETATVTAATETATASVATEVATTAATKAATPVKPTIAPTATFTPTKVPTVISPTKEPTATVPASTPTLAAPTLTPTSVGPAPRLTITVGGLEYDPIAVNACKIDASGAKNCVSTPLDTRAPSIASAVNAAAQINFRGERPVSVIVVRLSADAVTVQNILRQPANNVTLYTMPNLPGTYFLAIEVVYPGGSATYFFRLSVGS